MSAYRIILYSTVDDIADPRNRFHARVVCPRHQPVEGAMARDGFAPVYFRGATADEAKERAQVYIEERTAAAEAKRAAGKGRKKAAPHPSTPEDELAYECEAI